MVPNVRAFNLLSLWTHETNGPSCNESHNFGFVFNEKMNEKQNAEASLFLLNHKLEKQIPLLTMTAESGDVINFLVVILILLLQN